LLKSQAAHFQRLLRFADVAAAAGAYLWALTWRAPTAIPSGEAGVALGVILALSAPVVLEGFGLYQSQRRTALHSILVRVGAASLLLGTAAAIANLALGGSVSIAFVAGFAVSYFTLVSMVRTVLMIALRVLRKRGRNYRNVVVVGSGPRAARLVDLIREHGEWGCRVTALADETDEPRDPELRGHPMIKVVDLPAYLRNQVVDEVLVAYPRSMFASVEPIARCCAEVGVTVTILSDIFGDFLPPPKVVHLDRVPGLCFAPVHHSWVRLVAKRGIDFLGAMLLLALAIPVLLVSAVVIRTTSTGPVLFRQARCGLYGRRFEILKLRTMYQEADEQKRHLVHLNERRGPVFKIRDDPRVTPVGRFLRRWSIDELPQLWNVIKGEMSLVGPRPPVPEEVSEYRFVDRRRLSMRPGLTCWWQVLGRDEIDFDEQVRLDIEYIDSWSLANDFRILFRTIPAVVSGRGAS